MDANTLSARVNQIRDLHYGSEQQPGIHVRKDEPCQTCDVLSAIDTGRFRLWDPVDNRPLAVTSREEVYRKALEVIRYLVRPDRPAAARFSRPTVEDIVAAALEDPPREVDPMSFTQDFLSRGVVGEDPDLVNEPEPELPTPVQFTAEIEKQLDVEARITMSRVWQSSGEQRHHEQTVLELGSGDPKVVAAVYFKPGAQQVETLGILPDTRWELARDLIEVCDGFGVRVQ